MPVSAYLSNNNNKCHIFQGEFINKQINNIHTCVHLCVGSCIRIHPHDHPLIKSAWACAVCRFCRWCPTSICSSFGIKNRAVLITDLCFDNITCRRETFARYFDFNHRTVAVGAQMRIVLRIFECLEPDCGQSLWHPKTSPPQFNKASSPPMAANRLPWAADIVGEYSPIAAPSRFLKGTDITTGFFFLFPKLALSLLLSSAVSWLFLKNSVLCWAHLSRSFEKKPTRALLPHSSDRDPGTLSDAS